MANPSWPAQQRENLLPYSEQLDQAAWVKTNVTVVANALMAPDGLVTADQVNEGVAAGNHNIYEFPLPAEAVGEYRCYSVFLKNGNLPYVAVQDALGGTNINCRLDLGTIPSAGAGVLARGVQTNPLWGVGWARYWFVKLVSTLAGRCMLDAQFDASFSFATYTGTSRTFYAWGAMCERVTNLNGPSAYIPTPAAVAVTINDYSLPGPMPQPYSETDPTYDPYDNIIRSQPDVGQSKKRRRFTGKNEKLKFTLQLTATQRITFFNFYDVTLKETLPFDWIDFRTGKAQTYCFSRRPTETWLGGDHGVGWWRVDVELETLY